MTFIGDFSFIFPILLIVLLIVYLAFLFHEVKALPRLLKEEATINDNLVTLKKFKPFIRYILIDVLTFIGSSYLALFIFRYIFLIVYFFSILFGQLMILVELSYIILIYTHKFSPAELLVYRKKIKSGGNIIFITYIILYIFLSVRAIFQWHPPQANAWDFPLIC